MSALVANTLPAVVPCDILHPAHASCTANSLECFTNTVRKIFPLYASLTFVPMLVLKLVKVLRHPIKHLGGGLLSCVRSCVFLGCFCAWYQAGVCVSRNTFRADHKSIYFLAGIASSCSIFLEKPSRRSELALYVTPRALDSLYFLLVKRNLLVSVPFGNIIVYCLSMGSLMYFFHDHPHKTMSPLVSTIFNWHFNEQRIM